MKLLYQAELGGRSLEDLCRNFEEYEAAPDHVKKFALELARGVLERRDEMDEKIAGALERWDFKRLAAVDMQLLRLALYEMLFCDDISANVAISEAIELSRQYSTAQSSRFVNGVLGKLCDMYAPHKVTRTRKG
jgi:N utilization substance protein B